MRAGLKLCQRQAFRVAAKPVPVRAAAEHDVEQPLRANAVAYRRDQLGRIAAGDRRSFAARLAAGQLECKEVVDRGDVGSCAGAAGNRGKSQQDLPLVEHPFRWLEDRRRVVGEVADREDGEDEVEVRMLKR